VIRAARGVKSIRMAKPSRRRSPAASAAGSIGGTGERAMAGGIEEALGNERESFSQCSIAERLPRLL
jgi:hypothetical protein